MKKEGLKIRQKRVYDSKGQKGVRARGCDRTRGKAKTGGKGVIGRYRGQSGTEFGGRAGDSRRRDARGESSHGKRKAGIYKQYKKTPGRNSCRSAAVKTLLGSGGTKSYKVQPGPVAEGGPLMVRRERQKRMRCEKSGS